jgi:hypothetical protein
MSHKTYQRFVLSFLFCLITTYAVNAESKQVYYGHNLSPTTNTLKQDKVSAGIYVLAYGLTDDLMIGTSPWITIDYNMFNFAVRYLIKEQANTRTSLQTHYFKTYDANDRSQYSVAYKMHALTQHLTHSIKASQQVELLFNLSAMYYWNEEIPFSLRRMGATEKSYQFNTTVMLRKHWLDSFSTQYELGILGVNYTYPQLIMGTSATIELGESWLVQLGFMTTSTPNALLSGPRLDNNFKNGLGEKLELRKNRKNDFSVHPEIQLEYFF